MQLPLPSGAEPAPPGGGDPRGAATLREQIDDLVGKVERLHQPRRGRITSL